jgi:methyl halide transferase
MEQLNNKYWEQRYVENLTGWDLNDISTPLKHYFDQLNNKELCILIPGAGNAYEAEYLHNAGFKNVTVVDWAETPLINLKKRVPDFPEENLWQSDFFSIQSSFDLIVEQTFFCALNPDLRKNYVQQMHKLLNKGGKLVGLFFNVPLNTEHPPFGGCKEEYEEIFAPYFEIKILETAYNSIEPRSGNELFAVFVKK